MVATKSEEVTKHTLKKTPSSGGSLIIFYWSLCGREWGGGWALIRGWALISNKYGNSI